MKKILLVLVVLLLLALVSLTFIYKDRLYFRSPILAIPNAKITFIFGKVKYKTPEDKDFKKASIGMIIKNNTSIKTEAHSYADIFFSRGTAIRISENSLFILKEYTIKKTIMKLKSGEFIGKFKKLFQKQIFSIKTPTTLASVRGTELAFKVEEDEDDNIFTTAYTLSGITEISNPKVKNGIILLSHQQKSIIRENQAPGNPEAMSAQEISRFNMVLNSIHFETVLLISNKILFELGSAKLLQSSGKELDKIAKIIKEKNYKIRIEGHTDNIGNAYWNRRLSIERAKSVKRYFIKKGIKASKLYISGYGSSKPLASNETEEGRRKNRRVEFLILE